MSTLQYMFCSSGQIALISLTVSMMLSFLSRGHWGSGREGKDCLDDLAADWWMSSVLSGHLMEFCPNHGLSWWPCRLNKWLIAISQPCGLEACCLKDSCFASVILPTSASPCRSLATQEGLHWEATPFCRSPLLVNILAIGCWLACTLEGCLLLAQELKTSSGLGKPINSSARCAKFSNEVWTPALGKGTLSRFVSLSSGNHISLYPIGTHQT